MKKRLRKKIEGQRLQGFIYDANMNKLAASLPGPHPRRGWKDGTKKDVILEFPMTPIMEAGKLYHVGIEDPEPRRGTQCVAIGIAVGNKKIAKAIFNCRRINAH